ncbi:MAG: DUF2079 domain-containing protein [Clostridia bacterium]|nr:DUF2079 domain-containing protein [Clostridia bacterium]
MKKESITSVFFFGNLIRRVIGAWLLTAYAVLIFNEKDFSSKNFLQDVNLLTPLFILIVLFFALSALSYAVSSFKTDSLSMLVGALLLSLTWIIKSNGINEKNWLFCFTMIAATALIVWDFIAQNHEVLNRFHFQEKATIFVFILCGVICAGVIAVITCFRYINFAAPTFDFGIFVQMFHNMSETLIPETTCERNEFLSHFAVHLSPICYVLLPFYWLFPSPLTLQIGQAVVVASGIVPFYLIMRCYGLSSRARAGFSVVYMLFPIISRGCFYDFHENCFLLPLLLWTFWAYETEKIPFTVLFTLLCCMVKEDAAVYIAVFALYCILSGETKKRKLCGVGMFAFAVLYFLFATWYINVFGEGIMSNRYQNISTDGSLIGVIYTVFANPGMFLQQLMNKGWDSVLYILAFLAPLGFLPLASKKIVRYVLLLPIFLNLLTAWQYQLEFIYQYHFGISAFFLFAAILNYRDLSEHLRLYLLPLCLTASLLLYSYLVLPEIPYRIDQYQKGKEHYQEISEALEIIPEDVSVLSNSYILPHIADRKEIYPLHNDTAHQTDFIVLNMTAEKDKEAYAFYVTNGYRPHLENESIAILVNIYWEAEHLNWYKNEN